MQMQRNQVLAIFHTAALHTIGVLLVPVDLANVAGNVLTADESVGLN